MRKAPVELHLPALPTATRAPDIYFLLRIIFEFEDEHVPVTFKFVSPFKYNFSA